MENVKFFARLEKSYELDGARYIHGIASGTLEDRDGQRVSRKLLDKFVSSFPLVLTDSHMQDGVFRDLGIVESGEITTDPTDSTVYNMSITARLDNDNYGAVQLWRNIQKGKKYGFSIEATNPTVRTVYSKRLDRYIDEYEDATPKSVSVTTAPSYIPSLVEVLVKSEKKSLKKEVDPEKLDEVYSKYRDTVNMSYSELKAWSETDASKLASQDRSPIERNLRLLQKPKSEWTNQDIKDANRTISFVSRMSAGEQGEEYKDSGYSKRDISLKNWAFNPNKKASKSEGVDNISSLYKTTNVDEKSKTNKDNQTETTAEDVKTQPDTQVAPENEGVEAQDAGTQNESPESESVQKSTGKKPNKLRTDLEELRKEVSNLKSMIEKMYDKPKKKTKKIKKSTENNEEILQKMVAVVEDLKSEIRSMPKPKKSVASVISKSFDEKADTYEVDMNDPESLQKLQYQLIQKGLKPIKH